MEIYYKIVIGILYVCFGYIRYNYHKIYKQDKETILFRKFFKREKQLVLWVAIVFNSTYLLYWFTPILAWATLLPFVVRIVGVLLSISGLYLFWLTHNALGTSWSPLLEVKKEHKLITTGIYKHIRHPMYTAILVFTLGLGLISANLVVLLLPLIIFSILCYVRISDEEGMMISWFGDEYILYKRKTGMLFPKFRK